MARIHDLLKQVSDPTLRARLEEEVDRLTKNKKFGLVFEEHIPECTPLYDIPVRRGASVARNVPGKINDVYRVVKIEGDVAVCCKSDSSLEQIPVRDLIAVAQFGDPIYPYLQPIDSVCNAPDSDLWHTLIEADNYHALQLLEYLYAGKVDCIYIDPPYNTRAKDWKYNNDYVDPNDAFKHSKWLSMMKKRLLLAKKLLNPADSVLIVTIDEKEYLHLGCLLEELFPEARIQMITSVINRKGVSHKGNRSVTSKKEITQFSRVAEYLFFVMLGEASIRKAEQNMLDFQEGEEDDSIVDETVSWLSMLRRGTAARRVDKPKHFYPIFVEHSSATIVGVGEPLDLLVDRTTVRAEDGIDIVWPMRTNGSEGRWQLKRETFIRALKEGWAKLGSYNKRSNRWAINYLNQGIKEEIEKGAILIDGKDEKGAWKLKRVSEKMVEPKSVWNQTSHNASEYGTTLLNSIIGSERFSFPKSLYAVKDTIDMCVHTKPDAIIIDFFAGSGTTLHGVNLINAEDGGKRRCILVTNNEVSDGEATSLSSRGYRPGDAEWERYGIARFVTWPRISCCIMGVDTNGNPLTGSYGVDVERFIADNEYRGKYVKKKVPAYPALASMKMSDGFAANCEYFKLSFLDRDRVSLGMQFREILPLLWLKAGAKGKRPEINGEEIPEMLILPENGFAVLTEESLFSLFAKQLAETGGIETVFFVTNSEAAFREMSEGVKIQDTYQLYRDYLENFKIGARRAIQ